MSGATIFERVRGGIVTGVLAVVLGVLSLALFDVIPTTPAIADDTDGSPSAGATKSTGTPIRYSVSFPDRTHHYAEIEVTLPTGGRPEIEVMLPVWTPGSYLVRDYARHLEKLRAIGSDGRPRRIEKSKKNRWRVEANDTTELRVRYRVYGREMTVRTNWIEDDFAILSGAATFLTDPTALDSPHEVHIGLPGEWEHSVTGLPPLDDAINGGAHSYRAPDFDTLVDCPIYLGSGRRYEFEVGGKPHVLLHHGEGEVWDGERTRDDVAKIVATQRAFWGALPYERYVFINLLVEKGGGLEHSNSTVMMTSRWNTRDRDRYRGWLGLVSHEFFHTWNVKRLRPIELGPFDYERENYTKSLWFVEGVTSYYDDLLLRRAGLMSEKEYLKVLSRQVERLQTTPGRLVHPLEMTSFDAWIKHYRHDENSVNSTISYYTKGAVVAWLLDAHIRRATGGERSLDTVMRMMYRRFSDDTGYTPDDIRAVVAEASTPEVAAWLDTALTEAAELDYSAALETFGLRFADPDEKDEEKSDADDGEKSNRGGEKSDVAKKEGADEEEEKKPAWLGLSTRVDEGRLYVREVRRETPAHVAGFQVADEILAIDAYRVPPRDWSKRLGHYSPGDRATVLVARRGELRRIEVEFGTKPPKRWKLEVVPESAEAVESARKEWLGSL